MSADARYRHRQKHVRILLEPIGEPITVEYQFIRIGSDAVTRPPARGEKIYVAGARTSYNRAGPSSEVAVPASRSDWPSGASSSHHR